MRTGFVTHDWVSRSGASMLVIAVHLVVGALFLRSTLRAVPKELQPIQVSFLAETAPPAPTPLASVLPNVITPQAVVTPMPEVRVENKEPSPVIATYVVDSATTTQPTPQAMPPLVSDVEYLRQPVLSYPPQSRRLREHGTVVLRVLVDAAGRAAQIDVYQSSGFPRLDEAARRAVRDAQFKPYTQQGQAQAALVMIPLEFSLHA